MMIHETVFNFQTKKQETLLKSFFYNKFVFPNMPDEPQKCYGQYLQTIYREISIMMDQIPKD